MITVLEGPPKAIDYFQRFKGGIPKITDLLRGDELGTFATMLCDDLNQPRSAFAQFGTDWIPFTARLPIADYSPDRLIPIAIAGMNVLHSRATLMKSHDRTAEMAQPKAAEREIEGGSRSPGPYPLQPEVNNPTIYLGETEHLPFLVYNRDFSPNGSTVSRKSRTGLEDLIELGYPVLASGILGDSISSYDEIRRKNVLERYTPMLRFDGDGNFDLNRPFDDNLLQAIQNHRRDGVFLRSLSGYKFFQTK